MWLNCCALHDLLLNVDRLGKNWEIGVQSDWKRTSSASNDVTSRCNLEVPCDVSRLYRNFSDGSLEEVETCDFDMNIQNLSDRCANTLAMEMELFLRHL